MNRVLNTVIVDFFKGCQSEYTNHQKMTEQDEKELISTKELNHKPCPSDVKMQILIQCTVCQSNLQSNFRLASYILKYFVTLIFSLFYHGLRDTSELVTLLDRRDVLRRESANQMKP